MFPPPWGIFPPRHMMIGLACTEYPRQENDRLLVIWWRLFLQAFRKGGI
jgi:hypothetical protein